MPYLRQQWVTPKTALFCQVIGWEFITPEKGISGMNMYALLFNYVELPKHAAAKSNIANIFQFYGAS